MRPVTANSRAPRSSGLRCRRLLLWAMLPDNTAPELFVLIQQPLEGLALGTEPRGLNRSFAGPDRGPLFFGCRGLCNAIHETGSYVEERGRRGGRYMRLFIGSAIRPSSRRRRRE